MYSPKFALMLSLLLFVTMQAESRSNGLLPVKFFRPNSSLVCQGVVGVVSGDTCSAIAKTFGISETFFGVINPNLNCSDLFVGQWVCYAGTVV